MKKGTNEAALKSDVLTVRLSPKLKYAMELVARNQHRNLSQVMEWALWHALGERPEGIPNLGLGNFEKVLLRLWSPYESDRLVLLATAAPHLMSFTEDLIWRFLWDDARYWTTKEAMVAQTVLGKSGSGGGRIVDDGGRSPDLKAIRKDWERIRREALASVQAS